MKKVILFINLFFLLSSPILFSQAENDTVVYLITCGPGTDTYSIYGHSALRVEIKSAESDKIYNWGVFDFDTPNFAWKFAKGRLNYSLEDYSLNSFLSYYFDEERYVISQKININAGEKRRLLELIIENLKPENAEYRYDFFYDDCSTRIRDLLEKAVGTTLLYPPVELNDPPTFRQMVGKYQAPYPWYKFGVDLIMGSSGDKEALFRDRMFLPIDLKDGLSKAVINRGDKMVPLLQNPVVILDFEAPVVKSKLITGPMILFVSLMILVIILTGVIKNKKISRRIDIVIYSVYSVLAILMIFFNFFTDHQQMRMNLNIIWLNPVIIVCLIMILLNKPVQIWFRTVFVLTALFLVLHFFLPQEFNLAFIPLAVIMLVRSSLHSDYEWNPLTPE